MIGARLDLDPADAVRYFADKGAAFSWDYTDVWRDAHAHAFTVAKVTTTDVLRTIRAEVERAIGRGQTFEEFKRRLRPRLQDLGWWGTKEVLDGDTGELTRAQLGSNRRLRTIFQTNVQTAYMAGRYKRFVDNAADRPYWRYVAIRDSRTRPAHAALDGKVFRWDDPIWEVIWPPNGWGCRCRVTAMTEAEFRARGTSLESGEGQIVERTVVINKAGDSATVKGVRYKGADGNDAVFLPDPGWDYNPGAAWGRFDSAGFNPDALGTAPITAPAAASAATGKRKPVSAIQTQTTWVDFGRPDLRSPDIPRQPAPILLPRAQSAEDAEAAMRSVLIPEGTLHVIKTPIESVAIRAELIPHTVEKREDGRERYAHFVLSTLRNPFEIWLTAYDDGSYRKRYIGIFQAEKDLLVIVRENRDGSLVWDMYNLMQRNAKSLNKSREGRLLYWMGQPVADEDGVSAARDTLA